MKKIILFLTAFLCCFFMNFQLASATEVAEEGTTLTVYVKNNAAWDTINIYAWDNYDGAATNMEWTETPMEDMGNGWRSYTLTTYKEFFLCFQDGGSVWTNDVPVEAGVSELYLDLTDSVKGEKQVCQYTEERPEAATETGEEGTTLTVYVKNTAAWDIINIYAWDEYDGVATNMEWTETPMEDLGNGWRSYTLTSYKEFFLCFQDGGSVWTNDVPVEAGVSELYLDLTDSVKGEKQVCQYTDERMDAVATTEEPAATTEEPAVAEEGTTLTVYMKNNAAWDVINIYAWDDYDGAATNMEWTETPMEDLGNGWRTYTLTTYKEFYLCFQDGGSVWTNDVPVEAGVSELYLDLTDSVKGEKQVCQYTDARPGEESAAEEETLAEEESAEVEESVEEAVATAEESGMSGAAIAGIVAVVVVALAVCAYLILNKKKNAKESKK